MNAVAAGSMETVGDLLAWAVAELRSTSDSARLDAELLLADCAGLDRARIMAFPERTVDAEQTARFTDRVARRRRGEPLAYILGYREFFSLRLEVDPGVLVPRVETELLVEWVLGRQLPAGARVLDLGTGSGAIALALKHERPDLEVFGLDRSPAALQRARANAASLGLAVQWIESDWLAALTGRTFDLIAANPPYVAGDDPHLAALAHEPRIALDGGADGLDAYRAIFVDAGSCLAGDGILVVEHGYDQREPLVALAGQHRLEPVALLDDLAGQPRLAAFTSTPHA